MAYRKTAKVRAHLEGRRNLAIACGVDILTQDGLEAMTTDAVAKAADMSVGSFYQHFPDAREFRNAVIGHLLEADITAIRAAADRPGPLPALAAAMAVFYERLETRPLARAVGESEAYRLAVCEELGKLMHAAFDLSPSGRRLAAAAAVGALFGAFEISGPSRGSGAVAACEFVLRGLGVSSGIARKLAVAAF